VRREKRRGNEREGKRVEKKRRGGKREEKEEWRGEGRGEELSRKHETNKTRHLSRNVHLIAYKTAA
jgi:hypothetical protein